ncbi:neutral zinc metallopeptidase [Jeongeupia sp. USM3]|uniref:KPN_02809 family neutral zinc metallopeptidase n=1 Tax=Jeongeupia sp. USM3 TaxID=1906741 RepID=UPI00089DE502|nr:neutral zinc metallopeptidase [Jeongeupia sp. USM3]AOX99723.1 neutral zinc metallopeptidase [Jeongeupia sp. USM3]
MRWKDMRESANVEDRRGQGGRGGFKLGIGGIIAVVVISLLLGKNPIEMLGLVSQFTGGGSVSQQAAAPSDNDQGKQFTARVLGDTEDTWTRLFAENGGTYRPPTLVLFRNGVASACGQASSAVGPFYCPGDSKVYLDLGFFDELSRRYGAKGEFAQAYVIAHEVGHHVQNLIGVSGKVRQLQSGKGEAAANALSVKQELQADCLAGVWGHHAQSRGLLEAGDLQDALIAAQAIGDDTLQRNAGRSVTPDSFTHGSAAERMQWLQRGFDSGRMQDCNTFGG